MRLSTDEFAERVGVSRRSVAMWSRRGASVRLRWDVQRVLDRLVSTAAPEVRARLTQLLAAPDHGSTRGAPALSAAAAALVDALLNPAPDTPAPPLIHLERAVARAHMSMQACEYRQALDDLPRLLRLLAAARGDHGCSWRVHKLSADAFHLAAALLLKLDEVPLAMLAAQRGEHQARVSGQPLSVAAGQRATIRVLTRCGQERNAAVMARTAAQRLVSETSLDGPRPLSAYGALLLGGALAYARAEARTEAMSLLSEASEAARRLGRDGNFGWTAFGPTNVTLHRIGVLLDLGDPGMAVHVAQGVDPQRITLAERKAAYHLGTARALERLGKPAQARAALHLADRVAPDEVRLRPANRALAEKLGVATA
jgi:tetratricopeptide (TPR) repeat protein